MTVLSTLNCAFWTFLYCSQWCRNFYVYYFLLRDVEKNQQVDKIFGFTMSIDHTLILHLFYVNSDANFREFYAGIKSDENTDLSEVIVN